MGLDNTTLVVPQPEPLMGAQASLLTSRVRESTPILWKIRVR